MSQREKRTVHCSFKITPEEDDIIRKKMRAAGIGNQSVFLRAMALNGYLLKLDLPELHRAVSLMGKLGSNVNQIARRLSERGSIYETEIDEIRESQDELRTILNGILLRLNQLNG